MSPILRSWVAILSVFSAISSAVSSSIIRHLRHSNNLRLFDRLWNDQFFQCQPVRLSGFEVPVRLESSPVRIGQIPTYTEDTMLRIIKIYRISLFYA